MLVCGLEMAASEVRLVVLSGTKDDFIHLNIEPRKFPLADDENAIEMRAFRDSLYAFFRENRVERVSIKKRSKKGDYAGGSVGFKMEAITQLYTDSEVVLVTPQAIASAIKRNGPELPAALRAYQKTAFEAAFCGLP